MKKLWLFVMAVLAISFLNAQQQVLVMAETFDNDTGVVNLNATGIGSNTGPNAWVVNNVYTGQPTYPNTPSQDSTVTGTINNAPNSNYLHIHNSAGAITNANWDINSPSDRFVVLTDGMCTAGITDVAITFFWTGEGNTDAYGEVYYRKNGGAWIKTGLPKYNNQSKWKYEVIQDTAFNNTPNLELGFRWVNAGNGATNSLSFGVDDIIVAGNYMPVQISINFLSPLTVCQNNFLTIGYELSEPMCDGAYRIQMSDATGSFSNPYDGGIFNISSFDTTGFISFQVPGNAQGNCYRIRVNRYSPAPAVIGDSSDCFSITTCASFVNTISAPAMLDPDTTCVLSAIDIKFSANGVFNPNNQFIAELSTASGNFTGGSQMGVLFSSDEFSFLNPGVIAGRIQQSVPAGCGYYIRVLSSSPLIIGDTLGPFCITRCNIQSHDQLSIKLCATATNQGPCKTIVLNRDKWFGNVGYDTCNNWVTEILDKENMAVLSTGGLGTFHSTTDGNYSVCIPNNATQLPVPPGNYYMRIRSTCSQYLWNQTGTLVRLAIGAPDSVAPQIFTTDSVFCNQGIVPLTISPFNYPNTNYQWASNGVNGGNTFTWYYNPLLVDFTAAILGNYTFYVREDNYGCYGPYSNAKIIIINGAPDITIAGPLVTCVGDTFTYTSDFYHETYYNWETSNPSSILDEGNNESRFVFSNLGQYILHNYALNECGSDSASLAINVSPALQVNAGLDDTLCAGQNITLQATPVTGGNTYSWNTGDTSATLTVAPQQTTTYIISVSSPTGCNASDVVLITVENCIGINEAEKSEDFQIVPNPSNGQLFIQGSYAYKKITVYDYQGKEILTGGSSTRLLDISGFNDGVYLVVASQKEKNIVRRIMLTR